MPAKATLPAALCDLAMRQLGLVTTRQVQSVCGRHGVSLLRDAGVLEPVGSGVHRLAGALPTFRQRAMAAHLAYGPPSAVSHLSAARLWGATVPSGQLIHVTVPPARSGRRAGVTTRRAELASDDVRSRHGVPVTSPVRTLLDLTPTSGTAFLTQVIDEFVRERTLAVADLEALTTAPGGRPGRRRLATTVGAYLDGGGGQTDSEWETRIGRWLVEAGLPAPVRQHQVVIGDTVYLLDMAYPEHMVDVEFDGWQWHRTRDRFDRDRRRASELAVAGWLVVTVTSRHSRAETVDRVRRALLRGGRPDQ